MLSDREKAFLSLLKEFKSKKVISIKDFDCLIYGGEKILMEIKRVKESRDKWRKKYFDLQNIYISNMKNEIERKN